MRDCRWMKPRIARSRCGSRLIRWLEKRSDCDLRSSQFTIRSAQIFTRPLLAKTLAFSSARTFCKLFRIRFRAVAKSALLCEISKSQEYIFIWEYKQKNLYLFFYYVIKNLFYWEIINNCFWLFFNKIINSAVYKVICQLINFSNIYNIIVNS